MAAHAWRSDPDAIVWRGDRSLPEDQQGVKVFGTLLGSPEFMRARLLELSASHQMESALRRTLWTTLGLACPSMFKATLHVDDFFMSTSIWPRLPDASKALLRSQVVRFLAFPSFVVTAGSIPRCSASCSFAVCGSLPPSSRSCRCGRPFDVLGHHRAARANVGVLGRRGFALESAAARVCQEAGGRVLVNVAVRDLDIGVPDRKDDRRLEVVADGLLLFHGAQIAVNTTLVSVLRRDGTPHPRSVNEDGAALAQARRRKELRHPELAGQHGRALLVVLGSEVGGRWSEECRHFLCQLASAKTRNEPKVLRSRARQAWLHRWGSLLACSSDRAFAMSLLERRGGTGADGPHTLHS